MRRAALAPAASRRATMRAATMRATRRALSWPVTGRGLDDEGGVEILPRCGRVRPGSARRSLNGMLRKAQEVGDLGRGASVPVPQLLVRAAERGGSRTSGTRPSPAPGGQESRRWRGAPRPSNLDGRRAPRRGLSGSSGTERGFRCSRRPGGAVVVSRGPPPPPTGSARSFSATRGERVEDGFAAPARPPPTTTPSLAPHPCRLCGLSRAPCRARAARPGSIEPRETEGRPRRSRPWRDARRGRRRWRGGGRPKTEGQVRSDAGVQPSAVRWVAAPGSTRGVSGRGAPL